MNPKRITDRAVARRLFKLDVIEGEGSRDDYTIGENGKHVPILRYSTDLTAAWRVYQKLIDQRGEVWITGLRGHRPSNDAEIVWFEGPPYPVIVTDPNFFLSIGPLPFPEAICALAIALLDMDEDLRRMEAEGK